MTPATPAAAGTQGGSSLPPVELRKIVTVVEETFHDGGPRASEPRRKAAVVAVIRNPYAGRASQDRYRGGGDLS